MSGVCRTVTACLLLFLMSGCTRGGNAPMHEHPNEYVAHRVGLPQAACRSRLPQQWNEELSRSSFWASSSVDRGVEWVADSGVLVHEKTSTGGFSVTKSALWWYSPDLTSRRLVMLLDGDRQDDQVLSVSSEGDDLVIAMMRTYSGYDDWDMLHWHINSETPPKVIAESPKDPDGAPLPTPLITPHVHHGRVSWLQTTIDNPRRTTVLQYDIASGKQMALWTSSASTLVGDKDRLVLADAEAADAATHFTILDARSGAELPVPAQLRSVRGIGYPVVQGDFYAWINGNGDLVAWQPGLAVPMTTLAGKSVLNTGDDSRPLQFLSSAGPLLAFNNNGSGFILDRRTWSFVDMGGVFPNGSGHYLRIARQSAMPSQKSLSVPTGGHIADALALEPLPSCHTEKR